MVKEIAITITAIALILSGVSLPVSPAANTLARELDPVVTGGEAMPGFTGVPLTQLYVYRYSGGAWSQIPWQFDEVIDDVVVPSDDGQLDVQDQLAFMAADAGEQAPGDAWLDDASSETFPRYELTVTDPLDPSRRGWVYVYRSQTLSTAITPDYVSYDAGQTLLTSDRYKLGLIANHPGFDRLELNGSGVDILDRTKIRVDVQFLGLRTEEALTTDPPVATRDGRVRVVLDGGSVIAYRSFYVNRINVDPSIIPFQIFWGRFSADLNSAAGGSTYYDPNVPGGVEIDGTPDAVPDSPAANWSEVSGATGTIVRILDFSGAIGQASTATTYYRDDQTQDDTDTGDKASYGDAGVRIDAPASRFVFWNWNYILPADQPNVGTSYDAYARNPLQVEPAEQPGPMQPERKVFLPLMIR